MKLKPKNFATIFVIVFQITVGTNLLFRETFPGGVWIWLIASSFGFTYFFFLWRVLMTEPARPSVKLPDGSEELTNLREFLDQVDSTDKQIIDFKKASK